MISTLSCFFSKNCKVQHVFKMTLKRTKYSNIWPAFSLKNFLKNIQAKLTFKMFSKICKD